MAVGWKTAHVGTDLGQDVRSGTHAQAGDLVEALDQGLKRAEAGLHLLVQAGDALLQEVDVGQDLVEQEALVSADGAAQGLGQKLLLALKAVGGGSRHRLGVVLLLEESGQ
ncbi:MAG TPA: hypothetical protein VF134_00180, partial [Candidatus Dormibacteraeota bacterium]